MDVVEGMNRAANSVMSTGQNRMSAKSLVDHRIDVLKHRIETLESLKIVVDMPMPAAAEEALWRLLLNAHEA